MSYLRGAGTAFFCGLLTFFLVGTEVAEAKTYTGAKGFGPSCKSDVKRLCKKVKAGKGRVKKCLRKKRKRLSKKCTAFFKRADKARRANRVFAKSCKKDIKRLCRKVKAGKGRLKKCLNRKNKKLSSNCRSYLGGKSKNDRSHIGKKREDRDRAKPSQGGAGVSEGDENTGSGSNEIVVSGPSNEDIQAVDGFRQTNSTNCMHASKQMIRGYRDGSSNHLNASYPKGGADGSRPARGKPDGARTSGGTLWHIQVLYGEHASSKTNTYPNGSTAIKANTKRVMEALDIMLPDTWVLAGVKYHNRGSTSMNNDGITHHWLVIVDKLSEGRYQYHDVSTGKLHEFTYDDNLGLLVDKSARNNGQVVTRIRVDAGISKSNSRLAILAAESHKALGNGSKTRAALSQSSYKSFLSDQYRTSIKVLGE